MTEETNDSGPNMVILDMGKKKRKQIKRLRKGRGKLMRRVQETVDDLKESEVIDDASQVVVVVVHEKKRSKRRGWF